MLIVAGKVDHRDEGQEPQVIADALYLPEELDGREATVKPFKENTRKKAENRNIKKTAPESMSFHIYLSAQDIKEETFEVLESILEKYGSSSNGQELVPVFIHILYLNEEKKFSREKVFSLPESRWVKPQAALQEECSKKLKPVKVVFVKGRKDEKKD